MYHPTDMIIHTTAFVTPVLEHWLEREIAQWVHPMKDRSDDPSHHERTLLGRSYISLRLGMDHVVCSLHVHVQFNSRNNSFVCLFVFWVVFLTCTFRVICYSTRLSWAHTPVINWAVCLGQSVIS